MVTDASSTKGDGVSKGRQRKKKGGKPGSQAAQKESEPEQLGATATNHTNSHEPTLSPRDLSVLRKAPVAQPLQVDKIPAKLRRQREYLEKREGHLDLSDYGESSWRNRPPSALVWLALLVVVTSASVVTRLYKIEEPSHVCWDETHFGKMGSYYINQTFFFDVHPPLGKMLIGLAGSLTGYDGSFAFKKPGDKYGETPYVGMRMFCASLGSLLPPLCFSIVLQLTNSLSAALLAAALVIFDTGTLALSQYILLDPIMLFFIMASSLCLVKFRAARPWSFGYWFWLFFTGAFLACAMSVKFVGLFVVLLVGFTTISDLWRLLGDLSLSIVTIVNHFLARVICLIIIPVIIYTSFFAIHFSILSKSGSGDSFFSSAFQSQLEGNPLYNACMPEEVAYGSVVTMKNYRTGGAYLHSHWHLYPDGIGAKQQQITTYGHKDDNNHWRIKHADGQPTEDDPVQFIQHGDLIRLEHVVTARNLHTHKVAAPVTHRHYQVTGYGWNGTGDYNDVFRVDITGAKGDGNLKSVRSTFRLVHVNIGCAIQSHNKQLPKWGYEQFEVTCNPNTRDPKTRWNIEEVFDARLPNISFEVYAPSFMEKFVESHAVMLQGNSGLKPKEGEVLSRPWQWILNYRGQPFSGPEFRVYLLGNPITWWLNIVCLALFASIYFYHAVCRQRGCYGSCDVQEYSNRMLGACQWLLAGWALHYLPFWAMGRVLYFHHYFPALLYNFMLTGVLLDYIVTSISGVVGGWARFTVYHTLIGATLAGVVYSFYIFSPMSYGIQQTSDGNETSVMASLRWLDSWDI